MRAAGYHLPAQVSGFEIETLSFGEVTLEVPRVTSSLLAEVIRHLETARERLRKRKAREIAEVLSAVFTRWRDRTDPLRQTAESALPAITRFSPAMVVHGLDLLSQGYGEDAFHELLQESGAEEDLEGFVHRGSHLRRAYTPTLTTHVLAGNIPGVGLSGLVAATLLGSASLAKPASGDPLSVSLWAASVARQDPEIGECLAVLWWRGGQTDLEAVALDSADVVIAYGSEQTIRELQGRVRSRFLGHGHRVSFGVVGREVLARADEVAERAAYDASLFEQQGCLSPHCFYVEEGGAVSPKEFAALLASAMAKWAEHLPPGSLTRGEAAAVRKFRSGYEAQGMTGKDIALFVDPQGLDWTVIYEGDPTFTPSCLHRTVLVKPVADLSEVAGPLRSWRPYLQAAGVAVTPERARMLADALGRAGVNRVCPLGRMQAPPLTWHQEGRFLLRDLLRWTDLEA
ncbi:MAG: acyl-CoA reductase [Candidatus Methylomirabilales bacterium]